MSDPSSRVPEPVARIADVMSSFDHAWSLCGGWAVDAWLGRPTRDHGDTDISVFHDDQRPLFEHLAGWDLVPHDDEVSDDSSESWSGRLLRPPAHIHARPPQEGRAIPERVDAATSQGFFLDIQLDERSDDALICNRAPAVTAPIARAIRRSAWGVPTLAPEILLFFKARDVARPHDRADFGALHPHLAEDEHRWLREAIALVRPGHPWLAELRPNASPDRPGSLSIPRRLR